MRLPTIYKRASDGSIQQWTIEAYGDDDGGQRPTPVGVIETTYGKVGGTQQFTRDIITAGKNVGRANETTPAEQAMAEAQSKWETKLKKGYVRTVEQAASGLQDAIIQGGVSPMLAQSFDKHGAKINFPAFVQPKLDGHRCIATITAGKATLWSRTQKPINSVPHIIAALEAAFPGESIVLDGELYNHDYRDRFEELTSFIRSATPKPGHEVVQFWIYDVVNEENQAGRLTRLDALRERASHPLVVLQEFFIADQEAMIDVFGVFLAEGYEGLMVRNQFAPYRIGARSYDLQKVKVMQDDEFPLVDVIEGKGKMMGKAVFVCQVPNGGEFKCKLVGKLDDLSEYLVNKDRYIGKMVTVKYQNLSAEGIPRFGVAMRFREDA